MLKTTKSHGKSAYLFTKQIKQHSPILHQILPSNHLQQIIRLSLLLWPKQLRRSHKKISIASWFFSFVSPRKLCVLTVFNRWLLIISLETITRHQSVRTSELFFFIQLMHLVYAFDAWLVHANLTSDPFFRPGTLRITGCSVYARKDNEKSGKMMHTLAIRD